MLLNLKQVHLDGREGNVLVAALDLDRHRVSVELRPRLQDGVLERLVVFALSTDQELVVGTSLDEEIELVRENREALVQLGDGVGRGRRRKSVKGAVDRFEGGGEVGLDAWEPVQRRKWSDYVNRRERREEYTHLSAMKRPSFSLR